MIIPEIVRLRLNTKNIIKKKDKAAPVAAMLAHEHWYEVTLQLLSTDVVGLFYSSVMKDEHF